MVSDFLIKLAEILNDELQCSVDCSDYGAIDTVIAIQDRIRDTILSDKEKDTWQQVIERI